MNGHMMATNGTERDTEAQQPLVAEEHGNEGGEHEEDEHHHFSHRAQWLRAFVLGANDGLVTTASLMLGVGAGKADLHSVQLSGIAGLTAGALSMACGEYISVASQRDAQQADIQLEIVEQEKGPEAQQRELEELAEIYVKRGVSRELAQEVAVQLTAYDVIRAHARDELNIDLDDLANPLQAALVSCLAFGLGGAVPLLAGAFIPLEGWRELAVAVAAVLGLLSFGVVAGCFGGARPLLGAMRVLLGGSLAMAITYGIGHLVGQSVA